MRTPQTEGPPAPPKGTGLMAALRWGLVIGSAILAAVMVLKAVGVVEWSRPSGDGTLYHCPMHTTYVSDRPGECPICGMDLVPVQSEKAGPSDFAGTHPAMESAGEPGPGEATYTCPMHPEVVSVAPGKCPKCGMDLEPSGKAPEPLSSVTVAIPGLAPVEIPLDRVQMIGVTTEEAVRGPLELVREYPAFIALDEGRVFSVQVRFSGYIEDLKVRETGQKVRKGEVLFSIYSPELFQAEQDFAVLREARAGSAVLSAARERLRLYGIPEGEVRRLEEGGPPSPTVTIQAPASGWVIEKNIFSGSYVQPGLLLMTIADLSRVFVLVDVPESDVPLIHPGDSIRVDPAADPQARLEGRVDLLYPALDPKTRTLRVRATVDNHGLRLRPGMFAKATIIRRLPEAVVIPWGAVLVEGQRYYVFVEKGRGRFEPREVRLGVRSGELVEVREGIKPGERVVTSANFLIDSESRLQASLRAFGIDKGQREAEAPGHGSH